MKSINTSLGLVLLVFYAFSVASLKTPYPSIALPLFVVALMEYRAIISVIKRLFLLNIFTLMVIASVLIQKEYELAWLIFVRANGIMIFALFLFHAKDSHEIALGMQRLKLPSNFVATLFLTAKSITLLVQTLQTLKIAAKVRNFQPKTDIFTYKTYANIFGALLLQAFSRAHRFQQAIIVRGFRGKIYTLTPSSKLQFHEYILIITTGTSIVLQQGGII